jgi:MFS family permease
VARQAAPLARNREFVALWVGQFFSFLGISVSSFAYPLVVLAATGSAAKAGLVGTVLASTTFVLRLPAGTLVDRWDRKRLMIVCDLGRALASGSLALALALGRFHLLHVLVVAFVEGSLGVLFGPAESAAVRRVVAPEQRRDAVAWNQSRTQLGGVIGPPLGGVLLAVSKALPFAVDALSYLVSLLAVLTVRTPLREEAAERGNFRAETIEGMRWLWRRPFMRSLLTWLALCTLAFGAIGLVILVLARDRGASSAQLGVMFAITSAGGVAGSFAAPSLLRRLSARALVLAFGWTCAVTMLLLLPSQSPYLIGALGAAAFFFGPAVTSIVFATIADEAPDHLQGRAVSGAIQISSLAAPVAPILGGAILTLVSPSQAVAVYGSYLVVLAATATFNRSLRATGARGTGLMPGPAEERS